jgi:hypothetical protein
MSLKTQHLQFLDIRSYLAPNCAYDAFIKAYKCKIENGFPPYDYFDSYDKLCKTELPSHDLFYSKMKKKILVIRNIIFVLMLRRIKT